MPESWHSKKPEQVMRDLHTAPDGLSGNEVRERLNEYGYNELAVKQARSAVMMFLKEFRDVFIILLIVATGLSAVLGETADAIIIGTIVILVAITGFVQEYRAERAIEAMKKLAAPMAHVVREGKEHVVPVREIVPGDILLLESGDYVAADARLLEAVQLKTNEAVLTGESASVTKNVGILDETAGISERSNMVFTATHVTDGRGRAIVTSTGMNTEFGKVAEIVQLEREEPPPLQKKLDQFAKKIARVVVVVVVVIFALEIFDVAAGGEFAATGFTDALLSSISLAISAVPEGLPAIVTVALALGARQFAKRNAIVRRLSSAESMGHVTVICSDKTGTITKGEMTVRELYVDGKFVEVTGVGYQPEGKIEFVGGVDDQGDALLLLKIGALCNNAQLRKGDEGAWDILGDPTEGALIVSAAKAGLSREKLEVEYPRSSEVPFTSQRKLMATTHTIADGRALVFVKGAPETVLERCSRIRTGGRVEALAPDRRNEILGANERLAENALRVLAMAYKETVPDQVGLDDTELEEGLIFAGLQGMIDPPREEAIVATEWCRRAGIETVMITGDQKPTAMAVAKEVGILKEGGLALTGAELDELGDEAFERVVGETKVYARASPENKLRIVRAWQRRGDIVAMTGDGVNDAPALKTADVGVAMGVTGTDVTKEASDLILADDNFATIVKAVEQGRVIYDNIRKYARFLISGNFDELTVIGLFAVLGGIYGPTLFPLPLTAAMILWINLITDGPPAISLATDPADVDVMTRPPRRPDEGILHGMGRFVVLSFVLQAAGTILVFSLEYFVWPAHGYGTEETLREARTAAFLQAVLFELLVVWNCRSEKRSVWRMGADALKNRFFLIAEVLSLVASIGIVYVPVTQGLFGLYPLTLRDLGYVLGVASLGLFVLPEVTMNKRFWRWK